MAASEGNSGKYNSGFLVKNSNKLVYKIYISSYTIYHS